MRRIILYICALLFSQTVLCSESENVVFTDVESELAGSSFSGVVFISHGENVLYSNYFGYANREHQVKFDKNTVFDIGSITKQFLATAIMKLSEQGRLSVDDEISKYFKDVPADKQNIKLHHLLTHTSGLPANLSGHRLYDIVEYQQLPALAFQEKLQSEPGVKYQYSNIGYSLLARVVEHVTNKNWEQYISEMILQPSGLNHTGYRIPKFKPGQLATNYGADPNALQRLLSMRAESRSVGHSLKHLYDKPGERWMEGAGGFMSTVSDMQRWYLVIRAGGVLSKKSWQTIFTPYVKEGKRSDYGYGWAIQTTDQGSQLISHNGSNGYSFADFKYYPREDLFVFIATNDIDHYPEETMKQLNEKALKMVADKPKERITDALRNSN